MPTTMSTPIDRRDRPHHMPAFPCARRVYRPLFDATFNIPILVDPVLYKRIPVGATEREVYALLPRAQNFEYGGYITRCGVYALRGDEFSVSTSCNKDVVWHSHPYKSSGADYPSAIDLYSMVKWFPVRNVIVGGRYIWVFDKTRHTMPVLRALKVWEDTHFLDCLMESSSKHGYPRCTHEFAKVALKSIGLDYEKAFRGNPSNSQWVNEVRRTLKLRVRRLAIDKHD